MNRKGFTLIELLVVIVLIALIGGIAAVAYNSFQQTAANRVFEVYMDDMHESAIMYYIDNPVDLPTELNKTKRLNLSQLNLEPIKNPIKSGDICSNSYVITEWIDKANNKGISGIKYTVYLNCGDYFNDNKTYTN